MNRLLLFALALLLPALHPAPLAAQDQGELTLEEQLDLWLEWFPGRYDSFYQSYIQSLSDDPEEERNYRRHSVFRRVDLPAFGPITFYAEQRRWLADAPAEGEVYRQRIYEITLDEERQAIRLRVHVPKDQPSLLGAYANPSLLEGLTPDDAIVWPGCDLFWTYKGNRFEGRLDPGACRFQSPAYGQEVQLEEVLTLFRWQMYFADRGLSMDGEYLFGMRGAMPTIAKRVRSFTCSKSGANVPGGFKVVVTHDQGGLIPIGEIESDGEWPLRAVLWARIGRIRLDLLAAGRDGERLASAISAQYASHIGLDLDGIRIICRPTPERIFEAG